MNSAAPFLSPSEAARRLGASAKALRLYEQRGLITPVQGLDKATQEALIAHLRRRGPELRPLFFLTRSNSILDLDAVGNDESIILCPANHSPQPLSVRILDFPVSKPSRLVSHHLKCAHGQRVSLRGDPKWLDDPLGDTRDRVTRCAGLRLDGPADIGRLLTETQE